MKNVKMLFLVKSNFIKIACPIIQIKIHFMSILKDLNLISIFLILITKIVKKCTKYLKKQCPYYLMTMCLSREITKKSKIFSIQIIKYRISSISRVYKKIQFLKILKIWWIKEISEWNSEF